MNSVAKELGVTLNAVTYVLRKMDVPRRNKAESNRLAFKAREPSFTINKAADLAARELEILGTTLYWGEGYKTEKSSGIDFANSDPDMIVVFLNFLRSRYNLDEKRLKILLYCYEDQDVSDLIKFWGKLLNVNKANFTKPYIRKDFRSDGRKMKYGLVHIRYSDKKMLIDLLNMIESLRQKYRVGTQVVNEGTL